MKIQFLYIETSKEDFALRAQELYLEKIKRFSDFDILKIKSPSLDRDSRDQKIKAESKLILSKVKPDDILILFDERGSELSSREFAQKLQRSLGTSKKIILLIGGAFGVSEDIVKRANLKVSLSKMVMNHHVAFTVALEQIYRSFTIIKNIPYHND